MGDEMSCTFFVYIMQSGEKKNAPIKIGMSKDPYRRLSDLQTGNPLLISLKGSIPFNSRREALDFERFLHSMVGGYEYYGEWFSPKRLNLKKAIGVWNSKGRTKVAYKNVSGKECITGLKDRVQQLEWERDRLRDELARALNQNMGVDEPVDWL